MNLYAKHKPQSTRPWRLDEISDLLFDLNKPALKLEFASEELLRAELPAPLRTALDEVRTYARHCSEKNLDVLCTLDSAECKAEMLTDGVDPDNEQAVDAWLSQAEKGL